MGNPIEQFMNGIFEKCDSAGHAMGDRPSEQSVVVATLRQIVEHARAHGEHAVVVTDLEKLAGALEQRPVAE